MVFWDIPTKNPKSVDLYRYEFKSNYLEINTMFPSCRVFWRPLGSKTANKTDTITPMVSLEYSDIYECTHKSVIFKNQAKLPNIFSNTATHVTQLTPTGCVD